MRSMVSVWEAYGKCLGGIVSIWEAYGKCMESMESKLE